MQETVGRVTDLLLRPLAAEGMVIPAWFWGSAIGKIVARAARVTYGDDGLMSVSDAADRLGFPQRLLPVGRPTARSP